VLFHRSRSLFALLTVLSVILLPELTKTSASAQPYSQQELVEVAQTLIEQNETAWQVDSSQFRVSKVISTNDGLTTIRFTQTISGVPVFNSLLALTLLTDGAYLSHVSRVSDVKAIAPAHISARTASEIALAAFSADNHLTQDSSSVVNTSAQIADPALTDFVRGVVQRIWQVKIQNSIHPELASIVFVSDSTATPLAIRKMSRAFDAFPMPYVCDLQKTKPTARFAPDVSTKRIGNLSRKYIGQTPDYPLCENADPGRITKPSAPSVQAITETVNYFRNKIGIDIAGEQYLGNIAPYANFGKKLDAKSFCNKYPKSKYCVATISGYTNVCAYDPQSRNVECPLENAFWVPWTTAECHSGVCSGIFFGAGFDKADDVVAHELVHGVTGSDAFPTGLCENCDAGAISEALSDFFGEAVDQLNIAPKESADPNWRVGEDIKGGPFRNMASVGTVASCRTTFDWVPIKQIDDTWNSRCDSHTNLGPANRFAWLISNGGNQNGIEVSPIGTAPWSQYRTYQLCNSAGSNCTATVNMTRLAFQVMAKLDGNITYDEFGTSLNQACIDLTSAKRNPFPNSYCNSVKNALAATGIAKLRISDVTRVLNFTNTQVAISAQFAASNSVVASSVPMKLQFRAVGTQNWQTLDTENTNSSGTVNFTATFPSAGTYRIATVPGASTGTYLSTQYTIN